MKALSRPVCNLARAAALEEEPPLPDLQRSAPTGP
jgi:hypothetical protein